MNTYENSFVQKCLAGTANADEIDDYIDQWHEHEHNHKISLHEFLGMTWDEYALWVEKPESLSAILLSRHKNMSLEHVLEFVSRPVRGTARTPSPEEAQNLLAWMQSTGRISG